VTALTLTVPDTVDATALEEELVTALADRLRDEYAYELHDSPGARSADVEHEYGLDPGGAITVHRRAGTLTVKVRGVAVDVRDLFTGVSSELEQRHDGLGTEIG
jgi:hypothetical protein